MKTGYLKRDHIIREGLGYIKFDKYWRIVDENGVDMVQPWPNTKGDARETAKRLDIELKGERP